MPHHLVCVEKFTLPHLRRSALRTASSPRCRTWASAWCRWRWRTCTRSRATGGPHRACPSPSGVAWSSSSPLSARSAFLPASLSGATLSCARRSTRRRAACPPARASLCRTGGRGALTCLGRRARPPCPPPTPSSRIGRRARQSACRFSPPARRVAQARSRPNRSPKRYTSNAAPRPSFALLVARRGRLSVWHAQKERERGFPFGSRPMFMFCCCMLTLTSDIYIYLKPRKALYAVHTCYRHQAAKPYGSLRSIHTCYPKLAG